MEVVIFRGFVFKQKPINYLVYKNSSASAKLKLEKSQ